VACRALGLLRSGFKVLLPVDYYGTVAGEDTAHATLLFIEPSQDRKHHSLSHFETLGQNSILVLSGLVDRKRLDNAKNGVPDRSTRMTPEDFQGLTPIGSPREQGLSVWAVSQCEYYFKSLHQGASQDVIKKDIMALGDIMSVGMFSERDRSPITEVYGNLMAQLKALGNLDIHPQRPTSKQADKTCELKSVLAFLASFLNDEVLYQASKAALIEDVAQVPQVPQGSEHRKQIQEQKDRVQDRLADAFQCQFGQIRA
jgi:hypothetical protein